MKIARAVVDGSPRIVVVSDAATRIAPTDHPDDALVAIESARSGAAESWEQVDLDALHLAAPVSGAGKIIAVGLNYADHTSETGFTQPERPLTFAKYATSISGPSDDIVVPGHVTRQVDLEVELALLIGRRCGGTTPATLDDVAAYTVANDVSARDVQFGDTQWTRGKSFDTFTPLGPWLVTADEFGHPAGHRVYGTVNGEILQDDDTSEMIFDVPTLLAFVSDGVTLEPGDLILTGTPAGAGAFRNPARYLAAGDEVVCGIDGIGELRNRVVVR
ncbi:5-oxopent-3-ene-1,2,5-tricarboxylate decarboxylase [Agromyces rhizosphaerae]|uniref:5-oxopent-3-ene-1,2,5-tricarboxylate decarboxylase n=1 Tax=Agromyces rhizosphaerae TaxID=88374 RepID=A0A9W6FNG7_9MICO|nr:fumarylacetoacetate hydrolase family protein [Agromyces rhizosphaerae]GLI26491.1 5-oxopent-3-ene-1,2,5-tricarboxylate decarboxylase [Agromyces rhizosphaerae]